MGIDEEDGKGAHPGVSSVGRYGFDGGYIDQLVVLRLNVVGDPLAGRSAALLEFQGLAIIDPQIQATSHRELFEMCRGVTGYI